MALLRHHFGCQILWRSTITYGFLIVLYHLCQSVIDDLDVACLVKHNVLQFQISVCVSLLMEVINSKDHLSGIKQNCWLLKSFCLLVNFVKLSSSDKWHHEKKPCVVLKHVLERDQERMIALKHNLLFQKGALDLVHLNQNVFPDGFDRKKFLGSLKLNKEYFSKGASSQDHQPFKIIKLYLFFVFLLQGSSPNKRHAPGLLLNFSHKVYGRRFRPFVGFTFLHGYRLSIFKLEILTQLLQVGVQVYVGQH